jgi:hypothetical protein
LPSLPLRLINQPILNLRGDFSEPIFSAFRLLSIKLNLSLSSSPMGFRAAASPGFCPIGGRGGLGGGGWRVRIFF